MTEDRPLNRRDLIGTIGSGAVLGVLWGAAFPAISQESRPAIALVGHRHAQIAVIDTSRARVLVLVGEPDDSLTARMPAIMTLFRQRIDIVVGSESAIARTTATFRDRWSASQALAFQVTPNATNIPIATLAVTEPIRIDLDGETTLLCQPGYRDEWLAAPPQRHSPLWSIELRHHGSTTVFAPDDLSLASTSVSPATMVVIPDAPSPSTLRQIQTSAWAVNYDTGEADFARLKGFVHTRIFPEDISRFVLGTSGIETPPWTQLTDEGNDRDD